MEDCVVKAYADFLEQHVLFKIQEKLQAEEKLDKLHRETVERMDKELRNLKKKKTALLAKTKKIKQQKFEAYSCYVSGSAESFDPDDTIMRLLQAHLHSKEHWLYLMWEQVRDNRLHQSLAKSVQYPKPVLK